MFVENKTTVFKREYVDDGVLIKECKAKNLRYYENK